MNRALSVRIEVLEKDKDTATVEKAKKGPTPKTSVGPSGKGLNVESGDGKYSLGLGVRMQTQFQHQGFDRQDDRDTFNERRVKIYGVGKLGRPTTTYSFQLEGTGATAKLDDAFIQEAFAPEFRLRLGQFKMPASRQFIESSRVLLFVDRALASQIFTVNSPGGNAAARDIVGLATHGVGRNIGLQLWGDIGDKDHATARYFAAVHNGAGQNVLNENAGFQYLSRIELQPFGDYGYEEGCFNFPDKPRLALDAGYIYDDGNERIDIDGNGVVNARDVHDREITTLGLAFKWRRFSMQGEHFRQWTHPDNLLLPEVGSVGWYYQFGYLIVPRKLEIAFRDSLVDRNRGLPSQDLRETGVGLGYYIHGHFTKVYADHMRLSDDLAQVNDHQRTRVQYQYTF